MNLGEVKDRVRDSLGEPVDLDDEILRWIIDALSEIHASSRWPWDQDTITQLARGVLTDVDGDFTKGGTQLTNLTNQPTQEVATDYVGGLVRLSSGGNIYEITSWNTAVGIMQVATEIVDPTATGSSLTIGADLITLNTDIESVQIVQDQEQPRNLQHRRQTWTRFYPDPFALLGSRPVAWDTKGVDAAGDVQMRLFPMPSEDRIYYITYHARPSLPDSGTADSVEIEALTGIPKRFHKIIVARAIYEAKKFDFERQDQIPELAEFLDGIGRMKKYADTSAGRLYILQSRKNHLRRFRRNRLRLSEDFLVDI